MSRLFVVLFILLALPVNAADSRSINVFAIPSAALEQVVADTSKQLQANGISSFYAQGLPVHATLYLTDYPLTAIDDIKQRVERIAQHQQPFVLTAHGFSVSPSNWAFIDLNTSNDLQRLADEVTMALAPLRDSDSELPGWVKHYPNKVAAFERYGSPNVFQNYDPHLTLLANEASPKLAEVAQRLQQQPPHADGEVIGIGIAISDAQGQLAEVIARYYFAEQ